MALYLLSLYGPEDWYDSTPDQWEADLKLHDEFAQAVAAAGAQIVAQRGLAATLHGGRLRQPR